MKLTECDNDSKCEVLSYHAPSCRSKRRNYKTPTCRYVGTVQKHTLTVSKLKYYKCHEVDRIVALHSLATDQREPIDKTKRILSSLARYF